jgi:two-component system chemotaxis sensor kinase CheA
VELDLSRFRETFFQEAAEHLDTMESALLSLRAGQADGETLNAIFRSAHSIKAGAATFGFEATTRFTDVLESRWTGCAMVRSTRRPRWWKCCCAPPMCCGR